MRQRAGIVAAVLAGLAALAGPVAAATRFGLVGAALSVQFANGGGDMGPISREPQKAWGGGGGLMIESLLGSRFGLVAGLEYAETPDVARVTNHAFQFLNGGRVYEGQVLWTIRQQVMLLPVRVEYRHGALRVGAGPQVRYLFSAWRESSEFEWVEVGSVLPAPNGPRYSRTAQIFEDVGTFDGSGDATSFYERWTISALGSVGMVWPAGGHELRAEVRAWTDLTATTEDLGGGEHATAVQLVLGGTW